MRRLFFAMSSLFLALPLSVSSLALADRNDHRDPRDPRHPSSNSYVSDAAYRLANAAQAFQDMSRHNRIGYDGNLTRAAGDLNYAARNMCSDSRRNDPYSRDDFVLDDFRNNRYEFAAVVRAYQCFIDAFERSRMCGDWNFEQAKSNVDRAFDDLRCAIDEDDQRGGRDDNGRDDNDHDNNGHDDNGHDDNGHDDNGRDDNGRDDGRHGG